MEGLRQKQKVDSSAKKHGQPLMLGEDIDKQLQLYLQKVSNQGGVITASVNRCRTCGCCSWDIEVGRI